MKRKRSVILASIFFLASCGSGGATCTCGEKTSELPQSSSRAVRAGRKAVDYVLSHSSLDSYGRYSIAEEVSFLHPFLSYDEKSRWQLSYYPNDSWLLFGEHIVTDRADKSVTTWSIVIPFEYGSFGADGIVKATLSYEGASKKELTYAFSTSFGKNGFPDSWGHYKKGDSSDFDVYSSTFDEDNVGMFQTCGIYAVDYFNRIKQEQGWEEFTANHGGYSAASSEENKYPDSYVGLHERYPNEAAAVDWIKRVGKGASSHLGNYYHLTINGKRGAARYTYEIEYDPWDSSFWIYSEVHPVMALDIVFTGSVKFSWDSYHKPLYARTSYFNRVGKAFYVNSEFSAVAFESDDTISAFTASVDSGVYCPLEWDEKRSVRQSVDAYNWAVHYFEAYARINS